MQLTGSHPVRFARAVFDGKIRAAVESAGAWAAATGGDATFLPVVRHADSPPERLPAPERFLLPLRPGKIVCLGRNYAAHARELGNEVPEEPVLFYKSPTACIADGEPIRIRPEFGRVDYEGEIAVVISARAKDVQPEDAWQYVAGYTLVNDVTARDLQNQDKAKGLPWFRSKNLDTFCPLGPAILLREAIAWPPQLELTTRVNGEVRQQSNTSLFLFDIPAALAYITRFMSLEPGDVVSMGTPEGVGPLAPEDVVEVESPEIGTLRSPVELEEPPE